MTPDEVADRLEYALMRAETLKAVLAAFAAYGLEDHPACVAFARHAALELGALARCN